MDYIFYGFSLFVAASLLFAVAESDRLMELIKPKGKKCQSNYWGVYEGTSATVSVGEVEAKAPNAKHRNIMGSATYAAGKGVRMSGG